MPWTINIPESDTANSFDPTPAVDRGGLAELSEFYRQLGFEAGYAQAARDQLELSVATAEQVLREQSSSVKSEKDARRLLYSFIARIDRRLSLFASPTQPESNIECKEGYVEGGMGI